jgi:multiple sugar transport system substrate-binding protein
MKRRIIMLTVMALLISALSGAAIAAKQVTLTFWGWIAPEWVATYREFEKQHPHIKIKESLISQEWASSSEKFLAAMAAGNAPDVSVQNSHQFSQWASQGPFYDVRSLAERDNVVRDDWFAAQWDGTFFNDRQFALPGTTDTRLFYWNKDMFAEAGLDPEVAPATWDELEQVTAKVTKHDNAGRITQYGFIPYYGNTWTWLYGWLNGADFVDPTGKIITCDDPKVVYALEWMVDFYDKYCGGAQVAASFIQGFQGAAQDPFVTGKLAMEGNGNWMLWNFATFPDLRYGAAPMPIPNTDSGVKSTWSCGSYYAISADTKYPEEAWTFIKWLAGPEGAKAYAAACLKQRAKDWERQQLPGSPVYVPDLFNNRLAMEVLEEEYLDALPPDVQADYQLAVDALNWTHSCTEMSVVGLTYWNELHEATESALYHKMTAEEALLRCRDRVQQALDEAWATVKVR